MAKDSDQLEETKRIMERLVKMPHKPHKSLKKSKKARKSLPKK